MSFRVKLRIKSVNPYQRPVVGSPVSMPRIKTDQEILRKMYEAAKQVQPGQDWERRWRSPVVRDYGNLPYTGPNTCFLWNGVDPINRSAQ